MRQCVWYCPKLDSLRLYWGKGKTVSVPYKDAKGKIYLDVYYFIEEF